jgi:deoxyinosine 3'endonuclease (endonuclease V)
MIIAFDTYYYEGFSYTVGGVFETWNDEKVKYYITSKRECKEADYEPGEFYKRELPCIMQCLSMVNVAEITSIIVDGYAWVVDEEGKAKPGLGKKLHDAIVEKYGLNISVVGVAKNRFSTKEDFPTNKEVMTCIEVLRGESEKPLYITCSHMGYTEHYATNIANMAGYYRIPDILKSVDGKTRDMHIVESEE